MVTATDLRTMVCLFTMNAELAKNAETPNEIKLGDLCDLGVHLQASAAFARTLHSPIVH
jgi:hypothetical protein